MTRRALKKERLHARVISSLQLRHLAIDKVNVDWSDSVAGVRTGAKITRERCASTQNHRFCVGEPTVPTAATYLDELNPEQRRAVEHGVTQGCTVGPPHWCRGMLGALSQNLYISPAAFFIHVQEV